MTGPMTNWAGNVTFSAQRLHRPARVEELQALSPGAVRVRALGTGHSFNRIADSAGDLVSVAGLPKIMAVDTERATVTVSAGVRYGELASCLHETGHALRNLGSLPHISVGGSCATGTHGSGVSNGSLATAVAAMEMISASGDVVAVSRAADGDAFCGAVVALGAIGIVTTATLDIVPSFDVRQYVYENLPRAALDAHLAEILASGYSVSLFTDWRGSQIRQVWLKRRADEPDWPASQPRWLGARLADGPRHPVPGMPPAAAPVSWASLALARAAAAFPAGLHASSGEELQSEYLVPRQHTVGRWPRSAGFGTG